MQRCKWISTVAQHLCTYLTGTTCCWYITTLVITWLSSVSVQLIQHYASFGIALFLRFPRCSLSCNFMVQLACTYENWYWYLHILSTNTINTIPTAIAMLLILTLQIKRVCIATHSSYLVQNNILHLWYSVGYTVIHTLCTVYLHINIRVYTAVCTATIAFVRRKHVLYMV